jgi:hypothetical protein
LTVVNNRKAGSTLNTPINESFTPSQLCATSEADKGLVLLNELKIAAFRPDKLLLNNFQIYNLLI